MADTDLTHQQTNITSYDINLFYLNWVSLPLPTVLWSHEWSTCAGPGQTQLDFGEALSLVQK